jgi:tripartite-type tricarboxylate transporter receptor subunit TctC
MILAACASDAHAARAEDAARFYRTHTLTLGSPNSPGGGYDVYVRALTRYIGRYIPGHPTVIVQNIPAAGGMVLANQLYNTLPADGSYQSCAQCSRQSEAWRGVKRALD